VSRILEAEKADVDGGQLAEELQQVASLAPVDNRARFTLSVRQGGVTLEVPDETDEAAVREVIEAHVPHAAAPPPPTTADIIAAIASMNLEGATTVAGLRAAITPIRDAAVAVIEASALPGE
jgi:hypothetical protein